MTFTPTPFTPNTEGVWLHLPAETYHAAPGLSASKAKRMHLAPSPAHYKADADAPQESTEALERGTLQHTDTLEPDDFRFPGMYHMRPDTYPSKKGEKKWHRGVDFCKQWEAVHNDRPIVPRDVLDAIKASTRSLESLPLFQNALANGWREVSMFKLDKTTRHLLKCRLDLMVYDTNGRLWVWDLKTCRKGDASPRGFRKTAFDRGYHIQARSYMEISGASRFVFVAVEKEPPFSCAQYEPDRDFLERGNEDWRAALDNLVQCAEQNRWPGYPTELQTLSLPAWARREM